MNTETPSHYIVAFGAAIIYTFIFTSASGESSLPYIIGAFLGTLIFPLAIAGIIKIFASTKFSKIYMWTTVILLALSGLGHMMSPYSYS